jgi:hypothetical protein
MDDKSARRMIDARRDEKRTFAWPFLSIRCGVGCQRQQRSEQAGPLLPARSRWSSGHRHRRRWQACAMGPRARNARILRGRQGNWSRTRNGFLEQRNRYDMLAAAGPRRHRRKQHTSQKNEGRSQRRQRARPVQKRPHDRSGVRVNPRLLPEISLNITLARSETTCKEKIELTASSLTQFETLNGPAYWETGNDSVDKEGANLVFYG